jgi:hypothetical protein
MLHPPPCQRVKQISYGERCKAEDSAIKPQRMAPLSPRLQAPW